MTSEEFDAVVAQVRKDRRYEDAIRAEEAREPHTAGEPHDLEWNPYV